MAELPSGTITMLFSDIEGSTALLRRLGDRYGEALSAQRKLIRSAISAHRGLEMGTEGDSFYVVFQSATEALFCCVEAQRSLAAHDWPGGIPLRVRMGLHTGEPRRHEDSYIGLDVNRAARIAASAHGGQVVLSEETRQLVHGRLNPDLSLSDLGFHRLKDIENPEHLYQLCVGGLDQEFPPLKTLGTETSLPVPMTPLIGRDGDLEALTAKLVDPGVRLVTLSGPGGVGKTRLALAAAATLARAFSHGVYFVPLAAVYDGEVMWKTIARDLDVSGEAPQAVIDHLRDRRALLVLDNLEQLQGAADVVANLLAAAPHLVVLATSRGRLRVQGEHEVPVPPLGTPEISGLAAAAVAPATQLFLQQARSVRPSFNLDDGNADDVAAICRRLDGLPLAIELAAARVRLLAPKALLARLDDRLGLAAVEAGRPSRHQTLRATIAWSYELLRPGPAAMLRRAGVFSGGCDLDALSAVAAGDDPLATDPLELVDELLDLGLVVVSEGIDGEPRLRLPEVIREFALERLAEAGELDVARAAHARYYTEFAEGLKPEIAVPVPLDALDRLEAEQDNLRAALAWSLQAATAEGGAATAEGGAATAEGGAATAEGGKEGEQAVVCLRLVAALALFWHQHGHAVEGGKWLRQAMSVASVTGGAPLAKVAHGLALLVEQQGELEQARQLHQLSLAIWRGLGDKDQEARQLNSLGITHSLLGDHDAARSCFESSIAIAGEIGGALRVAAALTNLGQLESRTGNYDRAESVLQEVLAIDREQGDPLGIAIDQQSLGGVSLRAGRPGEALDRLAEMYDYTARSGHAQLICTTLELTAAALAGLGDALRAARLAGAAAGVRERSGMRALDSDLQLLEGFFAAVRSTVASKDWEAALAEGRALSQEEAARLLTSLAGERSNVS